MHDLGQDMINNSSASYKNITLSVKNCSSESFFLRPSAESKDHFHFFSEKSDAFLIF